MVKKPKQNKPTRSEIYAYTESILDNVKSFMRQSMFIHAYTEIEKLEAFLSKNR